MAELQKLNTIEEAIEDIQNGKIIIVVDDKERENEGDFVMAAEKVTPQAINFLITHGRGLVCVPMDSERLKTLDLKQMVDENTENHKTAFTVSVDAHPKYGVSTGISAKDRAKTIEVILNPDSAKNDLVRPGHIFPLKAIEGGVLRRAGHTEAAVDLARLAGLYPSGVICEIIKENGEMARLKELLELAKKYNLKIISIASLINYRLKREKLIRKFSETKLPTKYGDFTLLGYEDILNGDTHMALVKGGVARKKDVLVRVHSSCFTGDIFGSLRCDCGPQLHRAMKMVDQEGRGAVIYLSQEGRGIGLLNKIRSYKLQEEGRDTVEANLELGFNEDERDYGVGANIMRELGLGKIKLISNNPVKRAGLEGYGIRIVENVPLEVDPNPFNEFYLKTKADKMGHSLTCSKSDWKKSGSSG